MLEALFQPFALKGLTLRNRFVMAPMSRGRSPGGVPAPEAAEYYRRRAAGGVGLIVTEGALVDHPLAADPGSRVPRMAAQTVPAWRAVTDAVHREGGAVFVQLWHQGPQAARGIAAFAVPDRGVTAATEADLQEVADSFAAAASAAKDAGFDGVEVHGAHGYFVDSFLRTHAVREPASRRGRFVAALIAHIRATVGTPFPVVLRFSQWSVSDTSTQYMRSPEEMARVLLPLRNAGVDLFHASVGFRSFWQREFEGSPLTLAGWTRRLTGCPVVTVGGIGLDRERFFGGGEGSASALERLFQEGAFDLAAVGRALIADPRWCQKVRAGDVESIVAFREEHLGLFP